VWHTEHWLVTGICEWFQLEGIHAPMTAHAPAAGGLEVGMVWQAAQLLAVGMCDAILPVADTPLWHLVQLVAALKVRWSMPVAGNQPLVVWHWLQETSVTICPNGLPGWMMLLWQVVQAVGDTPM
jgi:hypothetical protein